MLPCDRSVPKSSISVEEYIPGAGKIHKYILSQGFTLQLKIIKKGSSFKPGILTCSDLHLYRKDDELVLVGGIGLDPNEGCVIVSIP